MSELPPMRPISFAATTQAIIERRKTVTRRWGWEKVKPGDVLRGINKSRRSFSQPPSVTLACVEVVNVHRVARAPMTADYDLEDELRSRAWGSLDAFHDTSESLFGGYDYELAREGCEHLTEFGFVDLLVGMAPRVLRPLTRIEFIYREDLLEAWREQVGDKTA